MRKNLKNLFKAVSLTLATALTLTFTGASYDALAAEGTLYEAEDATIEGTPSQEGKPFVEEHASASGGKNVGFFGVAGNKITWTVEHEGGEVTLDFVLASGAFSFETMGNGPMQLMDAVKLYLNDEELAFDDITLEGNESYDNWTEVFVPAVLKAGTNTISLVIIEQPNAFFPVSPNIDCLKICAPGLKNAVAGTVDNTPVETYEAEDAVFEGAPAMGDSVIEEKASASGGKSIGYFGVAGNKLTWTFDHKGGAATLDFVLASGAFSMETFGNCDMQLAGQIKLTLNGNELSYNDITLKEGNYENWTDVYVPATLAAGANTVTLEFVGTTAPNIDCLKVGGPNMGSASAGGATKIVEKEVIVEKVVKENKYVNVPTPIVKTTDRNLKDIAIFFGIILGILLAAYAVVRIVKRTSLKDEDKKAFDKVKEDRKALKEEFEKSYKNISGAEEKEIARYEYKLKCREAKEKAYKDLENLRYGEGKPRAKALDIAYGKGILPTVVCMVLVSCLLGSVIGTLYTGNVVSESVAPLTPTSTLVVTGYDWGPGANKIVLNFTDDVKESAVSADMFSVSVTKPVIKPCLVTDTL
ncbi:MAG: hypothetical protein K6B75_02230, partial [Lachnospiraceae bacterium]|nr:hypothetical protein [Lachnospiraceae bacterium]